MLTLIWTDDVLDILLTEEDKTLVKSELSFNYETKNIGEAKLILRMYINRANSTKNITLSQHAYNK